MKVMRAIFMIILVGILGWVLYYLGSNPYAIPPFLNGMLMMGLPVALGLLLIRWFGVRWRTFFLGSAAFVSSQVLHLPFNRFVLNPLVEAQGWQMELGNGIWPFAIVFGLSAGVFEESARYIFMSFLMKVRKNWRNGLMFGAGHGGIEAFIFGALAFYSFLQAAALRGMDTSGLGTPEQVARIDAFVETFWSYPWYLHIAGAIERISAMTFHIAATLIVLRGVQRRNPLWIIPAMSAHGAINAVALYGITAWDVMPTEIALLVGAVGFAGIIFLLRDDDVRIEEQEQAETSPAGAAPPPISAAAGDVNAEDLEGSRYD
jgi:uncharacterized membrane protein YhfC